jgi:heme/copper-type cytochrome/quinol oxidase subunit 4
MPQPDPVPSPRYTMMRRFWRIFRLLALLSIVIAAIAVWLVVQGEGEVHASLIIATALGIGLTVLLGTGLMTLVFLSNSSGHDDAASPHIHEESDEK